MNEMRKGMIDHEAIKNMALNRVMQENRTHKADFRCPDRRNKAEIMIMMIKHGHPTFF